MRCGPTINADSYKSLISIKGKAIKSCEFTEWGAFVLFADNTYIKLYPEYNDAGQLLRIRHGITLEEVREMESKQ